MEAIKKEAVQAALDRFKDQDLYLHLETTNGAYTGYNDQSQLSVGAYIRNGKIRFSLGKITGDGPFRVGLKIEGGWVYTEGLTDWELDDEGRLLLAGHNFEGKLAAALELSHKPFE
ncbi:YojF family protein [Camelliibacillus cellulosilyticus]|uniref:YojF family protein n=1 Tax=Camelliibacillus cellulosilyticus TaxID=2174486 RepID=A0ABV9GKC7_9BACL